MQRQQLVHVDLEDFADGPRRGVERGVYSAVPSLSSAWLICTARVTSPLLSFVRGVLSHHSGGPRAEPNRHSWLRVIKGTG